MLTIVLTLAAAASFVWFMYFLFGPQALGLPSLIAVFGVAALWKPMAELGPIGIVGLVVGVGAIVLIIGMAMSFGQRVGPPRKPPDRP